MNTRWPALLACCASCLLTLPARATDELASPAASNTPNPPTGKPAASSAAVPTATPVVAPRPECFAPGDPLATALREVAGSLRLSSDTASIEQAMTKASQTRVQQEAALRAIRRQHFGHVKGKLARQEGLAKLEAIAQPALYPLMIEVFRRDDLDTKRTLMGIFERAASSEGDASLAWMAIFEKDAKARAVAMERVLARKQAWPAMTTPRSVQLVAFEGLGSRSSSVVARAGGFVDALSIVEALPWMIAGQVQATPSGGASERAGALAWIVVGSQTNYVSDLTPIVAEAAVAFDPEISTFTSGTYIRVLDASVVTYNLELHNALHRFAKRLTGKDTTHLGWDYAAWKAWHRTEFTPYWDAVVQAEVDKRAAAQGASGGEPGPIAEPAVEPQWPTGVSVREGKK